MKRKKLSLIILFIIILALIIIRLCLPFLVIRYVERQINKIPEYRVHIDDVSLNFYRGSYVIYGLSLWKVTKNVPAPFFKSEAIDLAVQWRPLLHGKLVAK